MALGVLFGLIIMLPPTAFWHYAGLLLALAVIHGLGFGALAGIFTWIIYAFLKRGAVADAIPLLQSRAIVLALTSASTVWILVTELLKY